MNKKNIFILTLALSLSLTSVALASNIKSERIFGSDRYETSAKICDKDIVSGENFEDTHSYVVSEEARPEEILASLSESEIKGYVQGGWDFLINSAVGFNKDILKYDDNVIINGDYYYELKDEYSTREGLLSLLNEKNFSEEYSSKLINSLYYKEINGKYYVVIGQPGLAFKLSKSKMIDKKVQGDKLYITFSGYYDNGEEYLPKKAVLKYENGKVVLDYYEELSEVGGIAE